MQNGYDYKALINILCSYDSEEDWFEFKSSNSNPEIIGKDISALSNSAALSDHPYGYMIWGIKDGNHEIIGTTFKPKTEKKGNDELLGWLSTQSYPRLVLDFIELEMEGKRIVVLEIPAAQKEPQRFCDKEYIRIGSSTRELRNYPEKERLLWKRFDNVPSEMLIAQSDLKEEEISYLLDFDSYFILQNLPLPSSLRGKIERFIDEKFLIVNDSKTYSITFLGALLFARNLNHFPSLAMKAIRIILYKGKGKLNAVNDVSLTAGYAVSFSVALDTASNMLKKGEIIDSAIRKDVIRIPIQAVREVLANTLIHQDLSDRGAGPMIEIFDNRLEGSNPGMLLVPKDRIIDAPPKARNEALAAFLRRLHIVEERGSGFDRIEEAMEAYHLPSPAIDTDETFTRIKLFFYEEFSEWKLEDRIWTVYLSSCLKYIEGEYLTNADLRERFNIKASNSSIVSRILNEALASGKIRIYDEIGGKKSRKYIPYWA